LSSWWKFLLHFSRFILPNHLTTNLDFFHSRVYLGRGNNIVNLLHVSQN
jgi:hypothetical protein